MPEQQAQSQLPGAPQQTPNYPVNFEPFVFDGFAGWNTKPTRPAIADQEMFICKNWMPLGKNNLRTLFDLGPSIYKAPANDGIPFFSFGNIEDTPICMAFLSSGSIAEINTITQVSTLAAPANTILNTSNQIAMAQWGSQYILMAAPQTNGYFIWDGTLFYKAGNLGPAVNISSDGATYNSVPNMHAIGGHGTGASFTASVTSAGSLSTISLLTNGSGYTGNDVVMIAFSGGGIGTCATCIAQSVLNSGGGLALLNVLTGGSGYTPAGVNVVLSGGGGIGAQAQALVMVSGGPINSFTVIQPGQGYTSPPTAIITDPNNPVAQATVPIMPFGIQGTAIETYTSRVWISNGAAPTTPPPKSLTVFTAPSNPADFSPLDGGGSYLNTNSFARVGYHALKQSNGFMYEIGDSSTDYISGVQTSGTPPVTTFSNQNVDPQVGSPWPNTVQVFSRAVVFANTFGVHALYGGEVQKVSTPLDGVYTTVAPTGSLPSYAGMQPSAGVAIVFGIHIYCLLLPIIDQYTGAQTNAILCWDGQKWWQYSPSIELKFIASQEINSVLTLYGTDGVSIYPAFNTPSTAISKIVQSKLWDRPAYYVKKRAQRVLGLFQSQDENVDNATICVDTENQSICTTTASMFGANWYTAQGSLAQWYTNTGQLANWIAVGKASFVGVIDNSGVLMGLTMTTTAADYTLISLAITGQQYQTLL